MSIGSIKLAYPWDDVECPPCDYLRDFLRTLTADPFESEVVNIRTTSILTQFGFHKRLGEIHGFDDIIEATNHYRHTLRAAVFSASPSSRIMCVTITSVVGLMMLSPCGDIIQ